MTRLLPVSLLALGLLLVGCATPVLEEDTEADEEVAGGDQGPMEQFSPGEPLPDAELPHLEEGGVLATTELRGTPSVVNFWASWCTFCVDEMPDFEAVHDELAGEVRFVGVNRQDNLEKAKTLAEETGVTYDLVVDDDSSFFLAVQARGMPTTLLVDEDGAIAHRHVGPLDADQLRTLIGRHLGVRAER
jgi:cytochrome c biogenesis protein CcmG, thiol:disulfide interchange protein DsbE